MRKIITLLIFMIANVAISQINTNNLIAWWEFDGDSKDLSGVGNDGEVRGAKLTEDRFGNESSAYYFDGIYDYIIVDNFYIEPFILRRSYTISFWILKNYNGNQQTIISKGNGFTINTNENLNFNNFNIMNFMPYNAWTHIACVFNGNLVNTYQNGILINTEFIEENPIEDSPFVIGAHMNMDGTPIRGSYFSGKLDEIGIWSKAMSSEEVMKIYLNKK